ncbi:MAG: phosphoribosylanthranilate isomerase [Pseudomonadota bacterium]
MENYHNPDCLVKICGLNSSDTVEAAVNLGASMLGFVFYPPSPRAISPELATEFVRRLPTGVKAVGLFVEPDDSWLEQVLSQVPLDMIQLHGNETPDRVAEVKAYYPLPIIKAVKIGDAADLENILKYRHRADIILLDAKPPSNVTPMLPGGNGIAFDWSLLADMPLPGPWMLSGGLDAENVTEAIEITNAKMVDVSSGVETAPGQKSVELMEAFLEQVSRC